MKVVIRGKDTFGQKSVRLGATREFFRRSFPSSIPPSSSMLEMQRADRCNTTGQKCVYESNSEYCALHSLHYDAALLQWTADAAGHARNGLPVPAVKHT